MFLVFAFGMTWATSYLAYERCLTHPPRWEEPWIAEHLARGEGFLSPFDAAPGAPPTSWSPPIYPLIVAGVYRLCGGIASPLSAVVLHQLNALYYGLAGAGLFVLGRAVLSRLAGVCAAAMFFIHPMFLGLTGELWDHYMALAAFIWLIVGALWVARRSIGALPFAWLGIGLGLLVQINASYVAGAAAIAWLAVRGRGMRRMAGAALVMALGFSAALTPWTLRNYRTFGRIIFIRGGAPFELWFANLPGKTGWYEADSWKAHPAFSAAERKLLLEVGENRYFDLCAARFRQEVRDDPAGFAGRTLRRSVYLFIGDPTCAAQWALLHDARWCGIVIGPTAFNVLVLLLAMAGACRAWRKRGAGWLVPLGIFCVAPFFLTGGQDRYAMPLRAMLVTCGGMAMACVIKRQDPHLRFCRSTGRV